ncbi:hypothetical protein E2C01_036181 [Portunus trituberculatus]|uniref:Uncharacterized protein n=1 Tax=Portunus trituberculatus TaxID=210409 RepID=A0A5B7FBC9_PORTR|nr:hypothetical protein [Portunus trituberculatus]
MQYLHYALGSHHTSRYLGLFVGMAVRLQVFRSPASAVCDSCFDGSQKMESCLKGRPAIHSSTYDSWKEEGEDHATHHHRLQLTAMAISQPQTAGVD